MSQEKWAFSFCFKLTCNWKVVYCLICSESHFKCMFISNNRPQKSDFGGVPGAGGEAVAVAVAAVLAAAGADKFVMLPPKEPDLL